MQIQITGRNLEVTPALKSFVQEKLSRLSHHDQAISMINVTFHIENVEHIAEATVHLMGTELHAKAESHDMYSAIDKLLDKLTTQVIKHKEKLEDHR